MTRTLRVVVWAIALLGVTYSQAAEIEIGDNAPLPGGNSLAPRWPSGRCKAKNWDSPKTCVPKKLRRYATIVRLKDFTHPVPDGSGGYKYEGIFVPLLIVHPHVALRWGGGFRYAGDATDKNANPLFLDRIYLKEGVTSWVSTTAQPNVAPTRLLDVAAIEITKDTLRDIAVKCSRAAESCGSEDTVRSMDLDTLKRVVDSACAADYTP